MLLYPPARSGAPGTRVAESRLSPDGDMGPFPTLSPFMAVFATVVSFFRFFVWVLVLGLALVLGCIVLSVTPETNPQRERRKGRNEKCGPYAPAPLNSHNRYRWANKPAAPGLASNANPEFRIAELPELVPIDDRASGAGAGA